MGAVLQTAEIEMLESERQEIRALLARSESEIGAVATGFERLANETQNILEQSAIILGCVQSEGLEHVLEKVRALGQAAAGFLAGRQQAMQQMLNTVAEEARLLESLSQLTRAQRGIARETQTLSVLTNIEVARLGQLGAGFQYLAHQLDSFSQSVTQSTKELGAHTEERRRSLDETRRMLAEALPRISKESDRLADDLAAALANIEAGHANLTSAPIRFQQCVEEIATQVAGVVAAVQGHDITRQQLEHVDDGLGHICRRIEQCAPPDEGGGNECSSWLAGGLAIQSYQLQCIEQTVDGWVCQIGQCLDAIARVSTSELAAIAPAVLEQERELGVQLSRIDRLEQECQKDNEEVDNTINGLTKLMDLVGEHLEQSRKVRDSLQLLTFNSIVEASHLGTQADAILEISQSIKRISISWGQLTENSAQAMEQILSLVEKARTEMGSVVADGEQALIAAQSETRLASESLHRAALLAGEKADAISAATLQLQGHISSVGVARDRLGADFGGVHRARQTAQQLLESYENTDPGAHRRADLAEMESVFAGCYTTEIERRVLAAALHDDPLPSHEMHTDGNNVELF